MSGTNYLSLKTLAPLNTTSATVRSVAFSTLTGSTITNNTMTVQSIINTSSIIATGNVGIGTATPGYKLDVNGPLNCTGVYVNGSVFSGGGGGGSSQWTTTGSNIYYSTGNVGIGTNAPLHKLDVFQAFTQSDIWPAGAINFSTYNANGTWSLGKIQGYVAAGAGGTANYFPGGLAFYTKPANAVYDDSTTLRMVLDARGYLGIGTSAPSAKLHVYGDATNAIFAQLNELKITGNGNSHWSIFGARSGHNYFSIANTSINDAMGTAGTDVLVITTGNNVGIGTNPGNNRLSIFKTLGTSDYTFGAQHSGQLRILSGTGSTGTRAMEMALLDNGVGVIQVTEAGIGYNSLLLNPVTGNVGIGKSNPGYVLDVNGSLNCTGLLVNGTAVATGTGSVWSVSGSNISYTSGFVGVGVVPGYNHHIQSYATYGVDQMIKNTNPSGYTATYWGSDSGGVGVIFKNGSSRSADGGVNTMTVRNDGGDLQMQGYGGLGMIVKATTGYVGIGTATPSVQLTVYGGPRGFRHTDGTVTLETYINSAQGGWLGTLSNHNLNFYTNNSGPQLVVATSGNVGIGTQTPGTKLWIVPGISSTTLGGTAQWGGIHLQPNGTNDTITGITFGANGNGYESQTVAGLICKSSNAYGTKLYFQTSDDYAAGAKNRMMIDHAGNVGIGTISPSTTLHVQTSTTATTSGILSGRYYLSGPGDNQDATGTDQDGPWYGLGWSGITGLSGSPYVCLAGYSGVALRSGTGYIQLADTGRVGIGTTNPATMLHITKSVSANNDYSLMTYYENTTSGYHDWAVGPYIDGGAAFAIRSGSNNLPASLVNLFFIDGYGTAIRFPQYTTTGTLSINGAGGIISSSSDRRIKQDIVYQTDTADALARILQLRPATFRFLEQEATHLGFIAQDVEQCIPLAVDGKKYEWQWKPTENGAPTFDADGNMIYQLDKDGNRIVRPRGLEDRAILAMQTLAIQQLSKENVTLQNQLGLLMTWAKSQGYVPS